MKKVLYFRVAGREVHLPRLIGSFILFAAFLMFVQGSAKMFDSWDNMKYYGTCIQGIDADQAIADQKASFNDCADTLYKATGIVVRPETPKLTARQFWSGLLTPIASILLWLAVLFIGYFLYRTGYFAIPFERSIVREMPPSSERKFSYKRKK
ncbi:MAG TPA: hypothetical protein VJG83_06385 [archaeon]|nr:hypothetical protein [archaeon]